MTKSVWRFTTTVLLLLIIGSGAAWGGRIDFSFKEIMAKIKSQQVAKEFVEASPTFNFDGISFSLKLVDTIANECSNCWIVIFEFSCLHTGYGDRSQAALFPLITSHIATITLDQYEIIQADLDGVWDMLSQEMLSSY